MKFLVIGSGRMGRAIAYDLLAAPGVKKVTLADREAGFLDSAVRWLELTRREHIAKLATAVVDARDERAVAQLMRGHAVVASASSYELNETLARAAIAAGASFIDLGGNNSVVQRQLALHEQAHAAGVTVVPDCGLAPGMVALLVADGMERLDSAESCRVRVGGIPVEPVGPLKYAPVFSVQGLTNEYIEPTVVLRDGQVQTIEPLTELEELDFPQPFGRLEAFQTSGGTSTLPHTYGDRLRHLDYKTIRYPGHMAKVRALYDLGLFSEEPIEVDGVWVKPRRVMEQILERELPRSEKDAVLVRVTMEGERAGKKTRLTYQLVERAEPELGLTAMMRTTAFPAATVAWMLAAGHSKGPGALPQERCLPPGQFIDQLRARGLTIDVSER
jgi:lysine 6-dehydrogenase